MSDPKKIEPDGTPSPPPPTQPPQTPQPPKEDPPVRGPTPEIPPTRPVPPDKGFLEPEGTGGTPDNANRINPPPETDCGCGGPAKGAA